MSNLSTHDAEQAAITAQCEAGTCDHPECHPLVVRVACETMQFFEIDVPDDEDPEDYIDSDEAREHFAQLIMTGQIDFKIERKFDEKGNEV